MPAERYFIKHLLKPQESFIINGSEFHHLAKVMRTREGEEVELVNGQGELAKATVQKLTKDSATVLISQSIHEEPSSTKVILAQAIPKPNRLEFILEKGTELGVDEFWLFPGQYSVKSDFSFNQLERMQTLVISAMKQCGRLFLPRLEIKPPIDKWPSFLSSAFFGDVEKEAPLFSNAWHQAPLVSPIIFITGPESGFSDKEVGLLRSKSAIGVKLHHNILRADTASLAAVSLMQHWRL